MVAWAIFSCNLGVMMPATSFFERDLFCVSGYRKRARRRAAGRMTELIIDNFAGGGGASMGIEAALGRCVDIAINHDESAIQTHEYNHPDTKHYHDSVWRVDPVQICDGRPVGLAWFSPDCRHFSRAKGKKPVSRKIRCLAWIVIRWAIKKRPRLIMLENVREFLDWGPLIPLVDQQGRPVLDANGKEQLVPDPARKGESYRRWANKLRSLGYTVEHRVLNAADYGAPTNRRRMFVVARRDGKKIKWPVPTHGPGRAMPHRTIAECIDWSIPCPSIFDRKKPLADKTLRRIALGTKRYIIDSASPFVVPLTHAGERRSYGMDDQFPTITAAHRGELALAAPVLARIGQTGGNGAYTYSVDEPLTTITSKAEHVLACATLIKHYTGVVGHELTRPLGTITQVDHHSLATACMVRMNHGDKQWSGVDEPLGTITAGGLKFGLVYAFLCKYFGTAIGQPADEPLHTITSKARFSVVTVRVAGETYAIADIGMRMLQPHELAKAQGFPDDYVLVGSKSNQVAKIGNSVPPQLAQALVAANW